MRSWKHAVALLLFASIAQADFGPGSEVVTIGAGKKYSRSMRVEKGTNVTVTVSAGDAKPKLLCGVQDQDGEVVTGERGEACAMFFDAGYSGKYRAIVANKGDEDIKVVVTVSW